MSEVRLIDANALKYKNLAEVNGKLTYVLTAEKINNAPTVEPKKEIVPVCKVTFDKEQLQEIVDKKVAELVIENERPQGEWIPVSERLPEENGEYLVTREAYIDRENRNMIIVIDISYFTTNYGLNNGFHKANTVIAWQYLPEPYKKGEDIKSENNTIQQN